MSTIDTSQPVNITPTQDNGGVDPTTNNDSPTPDAITTSNDDSVDEGGNTEEGVEEPEPDAARAKSRKAMAKIMTELHGAMTNHETHTSMRNSWAKASSRDNDQSVDNVAEFEGNIRVDFSATDNSDWWMENHDSSTLNAGIASAQGNQSQAPLMPTSGNDVMLEQGLFPA